MSKKKTLDPKLSKNDLKYNSYVEHMSMQEALGTITDEDLEKVNKLTVKPVKKSEVAIYPALLIDDQMTRNDTVYPKEFQKMLLSLPIGEGNFIGAPFLFGAETDHQDSASSQIGRIFDAWSVKDSEGHNGTMGKIFILKSDENEETIKKINSGVLKEVSIATKTELPVCSICNQDIRECGHLKGENECYVTMTGSGFCGEVSLVAIPGNTKAKILNEDALNGYVKVESFDALKKENTDLRGEIVTMKASYEEKFKKYDETLFPVKPQDNDDAANENVVHAVKLAGTLNIINDKITKANELVVKYASKYISTTSPIKRDPIAKIEQGMKGEDADHIVGVFFTNIGIIDTNLSNLETLLKFNIDEAKIEFTGDENKKEQVTIYMYEKIENILRRVYKIQGRFNLEEIEKGKLVDETVRLGTLANLIKFDNKEDVKALFQNMTLDQLHKVKGSFFEEGTEILQNKEVVDDKFAKKKEEVKPIEKIGPVNVMDFKKKPTEKK